MTPVMCRMCCRDCRLRLTPGAAAHLGACPHCGEPLHASSQEGMLGFGVFRLEDVPPSLPQAGAVSMPDPDLGGAGP